MASSQVQLHVMATLLLSSALVIFTFMSRTESRKVTIDWLLVCCGVIFTLLSRTMLRKSIGWALVDCGALPHCKCNNRSQGAKLIYWLAGVVQRLTAENAVLRHQLLAVCAATGATPPMPVPPPAFSPGAAAPAPGAAFPAVTPKARPYRSSFWPCRLGYVIRNPRSRREMVNAELGS